MLAVMLCHERRVQRCFRTGGICWLTIGREPGDLLEKQRELLFTLGCGADAKSLQTIAQGQAVIQERLKAAKFLIVLDDLWEYKALKQLLPKDLGQSRVLITTRNRDQLPKGCREQAVEVDLLDEELSLQMLLSRTTSLGPVTPMLGPNLPSVTYSGPSPSS